ncbi:rhodanese-like domain-containing protein [Pseudooceanicola sp. C21-150M6]|uniref:rhodanese-like domain-containing protein n=1 Tax=Pseudooceanicola sp. C21-150M6 TaxID=3434355 RepID=UPI003D7F2D9C
MQIEETETGPLEVWTPAEVEAALEKGEIAVIDVRTPQEFMFEHIEGALLMPMSGFRADRLPSQDGKRLLFYCGSSIRSGKMAQKAMAAGLTPVAHLEGGFANWKAAKMPYIGTDMASGAPKKVTP